MRAPPEDLTREELVALANRMIDDRAKLIGALVCPGCGAPLPCDVTDEPCKSCGLDADTELEYGPYPHGVDR